MCKSELLDLTDVPSPAGSPAAVSGWLGHLHNRAIVTPWRASLSFTTKPWAHGRKARPGDPDTLLKCFECLKRLMFFMVVVGAIKPVQKALKAALIADLKALLIDCTANELFHFCVAAPRSDSSISCLVEGSRRTRQTGKLSSKLCRAGRIAKAVLIFHWTVWQVAKPRTILCACTSDLCLHVCEGLRHIIGAIIPMDEAMEIREVADIEALPSNLPADEEGHLMVTAKRRSLFVSGLVKSGGLARYILFALEMLAGSAAILVSRKLPRAHFHGLRSLL